MGDLKRDGREGGGRSRLEQEEWELAAKGGSFRAKRCGQVEGQSAEAFEVVVVMGRGRGRRGSPSPEFLFDCGEHPDYNVCCSCASFGARRATPQSTRWSKNPDKVQGKKGSEKSCSPHFLLNVPSRHTNIHGRCYNNCTFGSCLAISYDLTAGSLNNCTLFIDLGLVWPFRMI